MCIAVLEPSAMLSRSISSEVAWAAMMLWRAAALMATTFCMTVSRGRRLLRRFRYRKTLMRLGFGTSARKPENGFIAEENCFVAGPATKHSGQKCEYFQAAENARNIAWTQPDVESGPLKGWKVSNKRWLPAFSRSQWLASQAFSPVGENK